ncbi:unnamed protein product [Lupinus luteus]|uniref:Replication protein A 70 kDa DNA-binding subunit B/D first OB fold domain-containing protein n=1 Tax=Lupinus luteus TaxID=3873 RepID=A0AAV1VR35_LUPLU
MILMDSKGDKIQVYIKKDEFNEWKEYLLENHTSVMHNFNVMKNDIQFKTCDHVYRMQFTSGTTLKHREFPDIPELQYDFKKFSDILVGDLRSDLLIEIIGAFDKLVFSNTQADPKKVIFSVKNFCGDVITWPLWEAHAMKIFTCYNNQPTRSMTILLTHARVKEGKGNVVYKFFS